MICMVHLNKWISKNKNKIYNFSEFSILCPLEIKMRITNLDLPDNDLDFIDKRFNDLNDYLSFNVSGEVETVKFNFMDRRSGNIIFECDFKNKKIIYPTRTKLFRYR